MRHSKAAVEDTTLDAQIDFLRMPSFVRRTGLGRSTIYRLIAERQFPSQVKLAGRAVGSPRMDQTSMLGR